MRVVDEREAEAVRITYRFHPSRAGVRRWSQETGSWTQRHRPGWGVGRKVGDQFQADRHYHGRLQRCDCLVVAIEFLTSVYPPVPQAINKRKVNYLVRTEDGNSHTVSLTLHVDSAHRRVQRRYFQLCKPKHPMHWQHAEIGTRVALSRGGPDIWYGHVVERWFTLR